MNIFQVFSVELLIAVVLMLAYAFFNEKFVAFEHMVITGLKTALKRAFRKKVSNVE